MAMGFRKKKHMSNEEMLKNLFYSNCTRFLASNLNHSGPYFKTYVVGCKMESLGL